VRETVFANDKKGEDLEVEQDSQDTSFYGKSEGIKIRGKRSTFNKKEFFKSPFTRTDYPELLKQHF